MHPSARYSSAACLPCAMATSVQLSTSSNVATRPVGVGAAVFAQRLLTTHTSAPNMGSTSISDHKSLNAVSAWLPSCLCPCPSIDVPLGHGVKRNVRCLDPGVVCLGGMLYSSCVSSCGRSCRALSSTETCNPDDCAEGCGCPDGSYYDDVRQRCVQL